MDIVFQEQTLHGEWLGEPPTGGDAAPIVLLHEGLGSIAQWHRSGFPAKLARQSGRAIFAYERRGYGASVPRKQAFSLEFLREEAQTWLLPILDGIGSSSSDLVPQT